MSYHYSSFEKTSTTVGGYTTTTTRTTHSGSASPTSSLVVREITETEANSIPLSSTSTYEILDEDRLTPFDFYSLMESTAEEEEEESAEESESDVEYHWFPSLLKRSVIELLDDDEGQSYMDEDLSAIVIEKGDSSSDDEDQSTLKKTGSSKRFFGRHQPKTKRSRKSDLVPVEVVHVIL